MVCLVPNGTRLPKTAALQFRSLNRLNPRGIATAPVILRYKVHNDMSNVSVVSQSKLETGTLQTRRATAIKIQVKSTCNLTLWALDRSYRKRHGEI